MTKGEKRIKVCTRCGAEFTARTDNAMYRVDCKPIVRRQQAALQRERKKSELEKFKVRPSAERTPLAEFLREIERYNRKHGTSYSYGQYVLKVEGKI